jgi:hypothetical protein
MTEIRNMSSGRRIAAVALVALFASAAGAQAPAVAPAVAPPAAAAPAATLSLGELAWLEGCWKGQVNKRDFREQWLPQRGNLMLGISQTWMADKTLGYEYLRLEPRADGVVYGIVPSEGKEEIFRFADRNTERAGDVDYELFVFERAVPDFPQRIVYRRGSEGWLYAELTGKVEAAERKVIYPMHRIDCGTGASIEK